MNADRTLARKLAAESVGRGQPLDWFEPLYRQAGADESIIPWADMAVNPNLAAWIERNRIDGAARRALVIGCGLGDDAERLHSLGFQVTAFDISATCIQWCRRRFPNSPVKYVVADLFCSPSSWQRAFDFVLEAYTLQVLPAELRPLAVRQIGGFVGTGGTLLVITRGRGDGDDPGQMPWPLVRGELAPYSECGLIEMSFEDYFDAEEPSVRRFRVEYRSSF